MVGIARYYSPVIGRYLSRDPFLYREGLNLAEYVNGKPTIATDPTGEYPIVVILIGTGIAVVILGTAGCGGKPAKPGKPAFPLTTGCMQIGDYKGPNGEGQTPGKIPVPPQGKQASWKRIQVVQCFSGCPICNPTSSDHCLNCVDECTDSYFGAPTTAESYAEKGARTACNAIGKSTE